MKSIIKFLIVGAVFFSFGCKSEGPATLTPEGDLNWLKITDIEKLENKEGKKFLVDMYTDWCGWCKVMDKKTFTDSGVKEYLDENFYVVKFNAEQKEPIVFKGKEYKWVARGRRGVNELAMELMNKRMSYPTMVYLDENLNVLGAKPGYKKPEQLLADLQSL